MPSFINLMHNQNLYDILAPQGINLPDQMALTGAAHGRIAGHVAHGI